MINLTIQSLNNKTIQAIDIANSNSFSFNQSQPVQLDYANYLIKVQSANTLSMENLGHAVNKIPNDWVFIFLAFLLIGSVICLTLMVRRKR